MRILHSSDLHGGYKKLLTINQDTFDIWIDTGDFLPNHGREEPEYRINEGKEIQFQVRWLKEKKVANSIAEWLGDKPCILVPGNHDFVYLCLYLKALKCNVLNGSTDEFRFEYANIRWAGHRYINRIDGEWVGELEELDMKPANERVVKDTDILLTHTPPAGILTKFGSTSLANQLMYTSHEIQHHLFGHDHDYGGQYNLIGNTRYHNAATRVTLFEV